MSEYKIETKCVQGGYTPGNGEPRQIPIIQSTTFKYATSEDMGKLFDLEASGYFYTRLQNPTNDSVAAKICDMEGGTAAMLTSSGQAANFFAVFNIASNGDHVVSSSSIYGGTFNLFSVTMKRMGIDFTFVSPDATEDELRAAFRPNTKAVFGETIANPALTVLDIERFAKVAHENGVPLIIDNTFATPVNCRPVEGGADIVTSGNHIWDNREVYGFIDDEPYLVRPANYPEGAPGKGWCIYPFRSANVAVINLSGRAFMPEMDCPFQKIEDILAEIGDQADIFILDFHAETTSEKMAMGFYLDGRVQAVVGTHTHVQTADARILPQGTAYITDLGMCGPWDSVLGVKPEIIIKKFTTCMPVRFELAEGPAVYSALLVEIDDASKKAVKVERILLNE